MDVRQATAASNWQFLHHDLHIKPEVHDVAVGDDILLAFQPELAGFARAGFALVGDVIGIGNGFGADKALFKVGMDDTGGGGGFGDHSGGILGTTRPGACDRC